MMKKVSPIAPWGNIFIKEPLKYFPSSHMVINKFVFVVLGILFKNNHEILKLLHLSDDALALFVGVLLQYICNLDQGLLRQPLECRHLEKSDSII